MQTKIVVAVLGVVVAAVLLFTWADGSSSSANGGENPAPPGVTRWEYKVVYNSHMRNHWNEDAEQDPDPEDVLNTLGKEGWELISVTAALSDNNKVLYLRAYPNNSFPKTVRAQLKCSIAR